MTVELDNQLRATLLEGDARAFNLLRANNRGVHWVIRADNGESCGDGELEQPEHEVHLELRGRNLSGFDLTSLTFTFVDFFEVVFEAVSLVGTTFDECTLTDCSVTTTQTNNLAFKNCVIKGGGFKGVPFARVDVEGSWFDEEVTFTDCDFSNFSPNKGHFINVRVAPETSREQLNQRYASGIHGPKRDASPSKGATRHKRER